MGPMTLGVENKMTWSHLRHLIDSPGFKQFPSLQPLQIIVTLGSFGMTGLRRPMIILGVANRLPHGNGTNEEKQLPHARHLIDSPGFKQFPTLQRLQIIAIGSVGIDGICMVR